VGEPALAQRGRRPDCRGAAGVGDLDGHHPVHDVVAVAGYLALAMVVLAAAAIGTLRWLANRQSRPTGPEPLSRAVNGVDRATGWMPPLTPSTVK